MLTTKLYDDVLLKPAINGADRLCIVTGYATSPMASLHFDLIKQKKKNIKIELIVGMCAQDGLPMSYHLGFQKLVEEDYPHNFACSYVYNDAPVHSKVYVWMKDGKPVAAFAGSANYTQRAFGDRQREVLTPCDLKKAAAYLRKLRSDTLYCTHPDVEDHIRIYSDEQYFRKPKKRVESGEALQAAPEMNDELSFPCRTVSLLARGGEVGRRSGLNWGQRPELRREPNQAYIPVKAEVSKSDFFPPRGAWFEVKADDGIRFLCKRRQDDGKAIHTPGGNSEFGEYFRRRLGVASGVAVTKADLERYGRTDVVFCKLDDELYTMDFSV
jgi:hypothetical protein